jgi:hypothetical protein
MKKYRDLREGKENIKLLLKTSWMHQFTSLLNRNSIIKTIMDLISRMESSLKRVFCI